jgi:hypothetical protein
MTTEKEWKADLYKALEPCPSYAQYAVTNNVFEVFERFTAAKDAEIGRLQKQTGTERTALGTYIQASTKEIADLKAENGRLREGVQGYVGFLQAELEYPEDDEAKMNLEMLLENAQALLSPADGGEQWVGDMDNTFDRWLRILKKTGEITVREDGVVPMKIQKVGGCYESRLFGSYDLADVVDWVSTRGGLEFLVPADGDERMSTCPNCGFEGESYCKAFGCSDGGGVDETEEQCRERLNTEARQKVVDAAKADEKPKKKTYLVQFFDGTGKEKGRAVSVAWSRFEAMIDHKAEFDPFLSWDATDVMELNVGR